MASPMPTGVCWVEPCGKSLDARGVPPDTEATSVGGVDGAGLDADFDGALFCVLGLRSPHPSMSTSRMSASRMSASEATRPGA